MAVSHASKRSTRGKYNVVFFGCPTPNDEKPRGKATFNAEVPDNNAEDGGGGETDTEGASTEEMGDNEGNDDGEETEENSDEIGEEEDEDEDDEDEDEEGDDEEGQVEGLEVEEATIEWPLGNGPGMEVRPTYRSGPMAGPHDHYAHEPQDPGGIFLRHLGGVFAETRATMREMREDVRESRNETKASNQRVLDLASMSTQHYENMHRASQFGWNALNQGMTMQLNALQNTVTWERKLSDAKHTSQPNGVMQALTTIAPLIMGIAAQVIHAVQGGKGDPPPPISLGGLGDMMGGAATPPSLPATPTSTNCAPPTPPPDGFMTPGEGPPPMGFGTSAPNNSEPPLGFDPASSTTPDNTDAPAFAPSERTGPDVPQCFNPACAPDFTVTPPSASSDLPTPFKAEPLPGLLTQGSPVPPSTEPAPPTNTVIDTTVRPTHEELLARTTRAPIGTMCHCLLLGLTPEGEEKLGATAGTGLVQLLRQCGDATHDHEVFEPLKELYHELSKPGVLGAALGVFSAEERAMLCDIPVAISQHLGQRLVGDPASVLPPSAVMDAAPIKTTTPGSKKAKKKSQRSGKKNKRSKRRQR
jgi:hypothetical protein